MDVAEMDMGGCADQLEVRGMGLNLPRLGRLPGSPGAVRTQLSCKAEAISDCPQTQWHIPFSPLNESISTSLHKRSQGCSP